MAVSRLDEEFSRSRLGRMTVPGLWTGVGIRDGVRDDIEQSDALLRMNF